MENNITPICIKSKPIIRLLMICAVALSLTNLLLQWLNFQVNHHPLLYLIPLFNFDGEYNLPAAFSGFLLFFAGQQLLLISILKKRTKDSRRLWWYVLCAGFFVMSLDEMFKLHEYLRIPGKRILAIVGIVPMQYPIFHFTWVVAGIVMVVILAIFFVPFIKHLTKADRLRFLVAGFVYLGGAVLMDMAGGAYGAVHGMETFAYNGLAVIEESLEMAGVILFIAALFHYMQFQYPAVCLHFKADRGNGTDVKSPDSPSV